MTTEAAASTVSKDATPALDAAAPVKAASSTPAASTNSASDSAQSAAWSAITSWPTGDKLIALTYDDGPDASYTPQLIEYLEDNQVPATFYVCGNRVKEKPEIVNRLVAAGFEIGNHTYSHPQLTKLSSEKIREQLQTTNDEIAAAAPEAKVPTMRPPFGAQNSTVRAICKDMGMKIILWDIDTEDWKKRSASYMTNLILKNARDGSIVLMHDRKHGGQSTVLETTKAVVPELRARGFKFVTVSDMLGRSKKIGTSTVPSGAAPEANATPEAALPTPPPSR